MLRAMQDRASFIVSCAALGTLLLGGCAYGEVRQVVRAQFASELNCPEVQLHRRDMWFARKGPPQYKVRGCGVVRTYTCTEEGRVSYDKPACTYVDGDIDAPKPVEVSPAQGEPAPGGDEMQPPPAEEEGTGDAADESGSDEQGGESSAEGSASSGERGVEAGGSVKLKIGK